MQDDTKRRSVFGALGALKGTEALGGGSVGTVTSDGFSLAPAAASPGDSAYLHWGKRTLDLFLASVLAIPALPVALGMALALRMKSRTPVLTRSVRLGKGERPFVLYRFQSGDVLRLRRDRKLVVLGRLLRRASLEEIPQLWNVLRGDMTLVGPRPVLPAEAERYEPWQRRRFEVKPGLTCLWQVSGRNKLGYDEWMRLDLQYIRTQSLLLDMKILLRTIAALGTRGR